MSRGKGKILVVDDNENNRDLISRGLVRAGHEIHTAEGGSEALDLIEKGDFDLVVLDVMMPGLSGTDVLRALRRHYSKVELPVIMATAKDQTEDVVEALDLGANDYVTKPIDFPILLARVQSHLQVRLDGVEAARNSGEMRYLFGELRPGLVLAEKYRLEETIGSGNFGTVFRATHLAFGESVAVKVLRAPLDDRDDEHIKRFQQEGSSALRLQHPNAVTVMDFAIAHGLAFLVMEMLDGEALDQVLSRHHHLSIDQALDMILPICDVLAEAHGLGIVHRDIKPANIFLHRTRRGSAVKVLDFGIAKMIGDAAGEKALTLDEGILGTPAYMAPERLNGRKYDGRSDVYSLGIMLYQMLSGSFPFDVANNDAMATAVKHLTADPTPLREFLPDIPLTLEAVVMSALRKNPHDRPDALAFGEGLRNALGTLPRSSAARESLPEEAAVDDTTRLIDGGSAARLAFDFSDLVEPPPSADVPLPTRPPSQLGDEWT